MKIKIVTLVAVLILSGAAFAQEASASSHYASYKNVWGYVYENHKSGAFCGGDGAFQYMNQDGQYYLDYRSPGSGCAYFVYPRQIVQFRLCAYNSWNVITCGSWYYIGTV